MHILANRNCVATLSCKILIINVKKLATNNKHMGEQTRHFRLRSQRMICIMLGSYTVLKPFFRYLVPPHTFAQCFMFFEYFSKVPICSLSLKTL